MNDARIEIKVSQDNKDKLIYAAKLTGQTLSAFILTTSLEKATNVIKQNTITLSDKAWERLQQIINEPDTRNEQLTALLKDDKYE